MTVLLTILSGTTVFVLGQLILKFVVEPAAELRKTIAQISQFLIEYGSVIHNPGVPPKETERQVSDGLKNLSGQLRSHLCLIPCYGTTARVLRLPARDSVLRASDDLRWLSNSSDSKNDKIYEWISKRHERICDSLGIYFPDDERWPRDEELRSTESTRCSCLGICMFSPDPSSARR
jgi:hypothetical protein